MKRLLKFWPLALALVAVLVWQGYKADLRREGALKERIHAGQLTIAALTKQARHTDTVFHWDTVRQSHTYVRTDSILATDTLWRTDTVRSLIQAERQSCSVSIADCVTRVAQRDSVIRMQYTLIADLKKRPGFFKQAAGKLPWILGGVVAGRVLIH